MATSTGAQFKHTASSWDDLREDFRRLEAGRDNHSLQAFIRAFKAAEVHIEALVDCTRSNLAANRMQALAEERERTIAQAQDMIQQVDQTNNPSVVEIRRPTQCKQDIAQEILRSDNSTALNVTAAQTSTKPKANVQVNGHSNKQDAEVEHEWVEARFTNGEWYPAIVLARKPDGIVVRFEDGIELRGLSSQDVRALKDRGGAW